jgi:hypothetical protein
VLALAYFVRSGILSGLFCPSPSSRRSRDRSESEHHHRRGRRRGTSFFVRWNKSSRGRHSGEHSDSHRKDRHARSSSSREDSDSVREDRAPSEPPPRRKRKKGVGKSKNASKSKSRQREIESGTFSAIGSGQSEGEDVGDVERSSVLEPGEPTAAEGSTTSSKKKAKKKKGSAKQKSRLRSESDAQQMPPSGEAVAEAVLHVSAEGLHPESLYRRSNSRGIEDDSENLYGGLAPPINVHDVDVHDVCVAGDIAGDNVGDNAGDRHLTKSSRRYDADAGELNIVLVDQRP